MHIFFKKKYERKHSQNIQDLNDAISERQVSIIGDINTSEENDKLCNDTGKVDQYVVETCFPYNPTEEKEDINLQPHGDLYMEDTLIDKNTSVTIDKEVKTPLSSNYTIEKVDNNDSPYVSEDKETIALSPNYVVDEETNLVFNASPVVTDEEDDSD